MLSDRRTTSLIECSDDVSLADVAQRTDGCAAKDLQLILDRAIHNSLMSADRGPAIGLLSLKFTFSLQWSYFRISMDVIVYLLSLSKCCHCLIDVMV